MDPKRVVVCKITIGSPKKQHHCNRESWFKLCYLREHLATCGFHSIVDPQIHCAMDSQVWPLPIGCKSTNFVDLQMEEGEPTRMRQNSRLILGSFPNRIFAYPLRYVYPYLQGYVYQMLPWKMLIWIYFYLSKMKQFVIIDPFFCCFQCTYWLHNCWRSWCCRTLPSSGWQVCSLSV